MKDRITLTTELILETFRLNGDLLDAGDRLVADIGLTSARWQVLGAVMMSPVPLPVAHLARNMGLSRQGVQRIANELVADGLADFAANPHHARAQLVIATEKGQRAYDEAMKRQRPWAADLGRSLARDELAVALKVLQSFRAHLSSSTSSEGNGRHGAQKHS